MISYNLFCISLIIFLFNMVCQLLTLSTTFMTGRGPEYFFCPIPQLFDCWFVQRSAYIYYIRAKSKYKFNNRTWAQGNIWALGLGPTFPSAVVHVTSSLIFFLLFILFIICFATLIWFSTLSLKNKLYEISLRFPQKLLQLSISSPDFHVFCFIMSSSIFKILLLLY